MLLISKNAHEPIQRPFHVCEAIAMDDEDLTTHEVAAILRVSPATIRAWLREGTVFPHAYQLPGKAGWRVSRKDIDALRQGKQGREGDADLPP